MKWWPRSLLWRTVLLITILLVVAHLAWLRIFVVTEREPRARQLAQNIASMINLTRSALITSQSEKRIELLRDLSRQEGIQVYLPEPGEKVEPLPDLEVLQLIDADLKQLLGPDTQLATVRGGVRGVWVSFKIDDQKYWAMLPRDRIERKEPVKLIGWGALVLLLALAGAYLIVALITRPLKRLTNAAEQIGHGQTPPPVPEAGFAEMQTLSRAFNQMASDLKRADDDRALLLAGVSHDLRTPLSRIRLGIEMLDPHADPALREGMAQDIEDVDAVINQFLDFARSSISEETSAPDTDLNAIVNALIDRYERQGKRVAARLGQLPPLTLKALAVQRLLTNLVDNALRYGDGSVEVETAAGPQCVRLSVLDRGPGIPAADAQRMLQPFTRLDRARSTTSSGLGLAIVDRIACMHGGKVRLLPRAGGGLEARVEFPLAPPTN